MGLVDSNQTGLLVIFYVYHLELLFEWWSAVGDSNDARGDLSVSSIYI